MPKANRAAASAIERSQPVAAQPSSLTDAAVGAIRSRIIDLTLEPSSRIDEPLLFNHFRLGRTPAREAINRLAAEGFVNIIPNRGGTFVRKLDLAEMGEIVTAQQLAETVLAQLCKLDDPGLASDLAAIQRSYEREVRARHYLNITELNQVFHLRMYRTIGNSLFYEFAESTNQHVRRLLVYMYRLEAAHADLHASEFAANLAEHVQIIDAVERKDQTALVALLPDHARATQRRLVRLLDAKAVPFFQVRAPAPLSVPSAARKPSRVRKGN
jgi:DNA-binding GntR family transcriptional regulator